MEGLRHQNQHHDLRDHHHHHLHDLHHHCDHLHENDGGVEGAPGRWSASLRRITMMVVVILLVDCGGDGDYDVGGLWR